MSPSAKSIVRDYYDALRGGDPLVPYFRDDAATVKFGISESLFGSDEVARALAEQTETTDGWTVSSRHLVVDERDDFATMADDVTMAWTDTESGDRHRFDSRWSGTLVRAAADEDVPNWQFAVMHVSAPHEL
ncbi:nuclear transport factor 2 family protein [Haloarchaeobius amylolyticus]|uniref:Nuclear transport factor 2 family protein n=1 Tax=Haloarchaeobius amylolyticus TaxID=1198296 RepID=A0ABD6BKK5_9EURY